MRLLDLCCGPGAGARGYQRAGFYVVGVDIRPQPHYAGDEFIQADALTFPLDGFAVIHASPPCDDYSPGNKWLRPGQVRIQHPRLILPLRERLMASGVPWVIENVRGALPEMVNPLMLCGTAFGLRVQRHRIFDCSHLIFGAGPCRHRPYDVSVRSHRTEYLGVWEDATTKRGQRVKRAPYCPMPEARSAMGIDWPIGQEEMGEAIPPAYTEHIGRQLLAAIAAAA